MCLGFLLCTILEGTGSFSFSSPLLMFLDSSLSHASGAEGLAIQPQKLLILDARSYAAAVANRAKGGGCECPGEMDSALSPNILSSWVQPVPNWVLLSNMNWKANHVPQPILREPELFGFLTLCSFHGKSGGGGTVKPNSPPSLCQPLGDKESQFSPIIRSVLIWKRLL